MRILPTTVGARVPLDQRETLPIFSRIRFALAELHLSSHTEQGERAPRPAWLCLYTSTAVLSLYRIAHSIDIQRALIPSTIQTDAARVLFSFGCTSILVPAVLVFLVSSFNLDSKSFRLGNSRRPIPLSQPRKFS